MQTTNNINQIAYEMSCANTLSELAEIKQHYGEAAVRQAWGELSPKDKEAIRLIADGKTIKDKSTLNPNPKPKQTEPLWQLTSDILELDAQFTAIDDDPDLSKEEKESQRQAIFEIWMNADGNWKSKAERVAGWIQYKDYLAEARTAEYRRIRELKEQAEKEASRTKDYLMQMMEARGVKKVEGVSCRIHIQKNGGKAPVVLDDTPPTKLPEQFQKISIDSDKQAIREALERGEKLPFASIGERGQSLRIK